MLKVTKVAGDSIGTTIDSYILLEIKGAGVTVGIHDNGKLITSKVRNS